MESNHSKKTMLAAVCLGLGLSYSPQVFAVGGSVTGDSESPALTEVQ